ncbi:MAG: glycoside hydrolase family 3 C-terminal domain-containing protein [Oscillospiraceae bacterium]|nr:glycoside hydrolase family 3 C-terminal domain-containing protein [Oscillospiraceae bacterium]
MRASKKRLLKKIFANISIGLLILTYFGSSIAGQFSGQINSFLGVSTSKIVTTDGSSQDTGEYPRYYESAFQSVAELKAAGLAKAEEVEAEGAVLLKNNGLLPLKGTEVSLFGATASSPVYGGTGSGAVDTADAPSYVDAMERSGLTVTNTDLLDWYKQKEYGRDFSASGEEINEAKWSGIEKSGATYGQGEVAIFVVGRVGGEANDLKSVNHVDGGYNPIGADVDQNSDYLMLNKNELGILAGLKGLKDEGKISGIVVLINSANPISAAFLNDEEYGVDAALWIGSVGQSGLYAVGGILSGSVNPSGSLPDTWWTNNYLNPAVANFGSYTYTNAGDYSFASSPSKFTSYVVYQEGIYLGYRYTETRYEDAVLGAGNAGAYHYPDVVAYPFGYGLSYTSFSIDDMQVSKQGSGSETEYVVTAVVTNTGDTAGKKAVQVYVQKPYTDYDRQNQIEKASVELAGYGKTGMLAPGESETVTVTIPEYFLTSYDALGSGAFILEDGTYYLTAASDSHEAINNILAAKGKTTADGMTGEGNAALVYSTDYAFDAGTYAKAYGTGSDVASLFASADINRYEGRGDNQVTYLSRSDWEGTLMLWADQDEDGQNDSYVKLSMTDQMYQDAILDGADIPADDGQWPVMGSSETSYTLIELMKDDAGGVLAYNDPKWDALLDQLTYEDMARLCAVGLRMTVSLESVGKPETLDHNGPSGVTQKYSAGPNGYANQTGDPDKELTGTCYPCNGIIAATMNDKLVQEVGELIGEDAMWAGYAGFYGSGLNIHRTPYAGRVFEYYSEDGTLTGLIDTYETMGIQSKGVYVYNKHFALNDQELQRQGLGTWCNEQAMREIYLRAFELPIVNADAKCVMTAFNRIGAVWSGACEPLLTGWLRGEAGMTGFAVTDMYEGDYMSKPHEVLAGNDIPDNFPGTTGTVTAGASTDNLGFEFADYGPNGATPNAQVARALRESSHRVLYTVLHSRGMDGIGSNTRIVSVTPFWQTALTGAQIAFALLSVVSVVLLVMDMIPRKKDSAR